MTKLLSTMWILTRARTRVSSNHLHQNAQSLSDQIRRPLSTIPPRSSHQSQSQSQSHYRKQISVAKLLQRYGFPSSHLNDFLSKNRSLVDSDLKDVEKSLSLLLFDFRIPQKDLASMVFDCPGVLDYQFLSNWRSAFSQSGLPSGSPLMIKSLLEHSRRSRLRSDGLSGGAVEVLRAFGFGDKTLAGVLEAFPGVTSMEEREIQRRIEFMAGILIPKEGIERIIRSLPAVLGFGIETRLIPLLSEFKALGFADDLIRKEIVREPRLLGMEIGELSRCLELLRSLNCREPIKEKILNEGELRAGFEVKLRVDYFCGIGLIRREAFNLLWKEPRAVIYKIEDIEKKVDFLVQRMKLGVHCLLDVPEYMGVNFDKQIVSRFNVIEYLRSRDGLGFEVGLRDMIKPSRLKFYNLYVKPYPECEKMFPRCLRGSVVKPKHPVGLWKSFKPQKYQDTKEDVKNMKSFMDSSVHSSQ